MGMEHVKLEEGSPAEISKQGRTNPADLDVFPEKWPRWLERTWESRFQSPGTAPLYSQGPSSLTTSFPAPSPHSQKSWQRGEPHRHQRTLCGNQRGKGRCSGTAEGSALAPSCTELLAVGAGQVSGPRPSRESQAGLPWPDSSLVREV